MGGRQSSIVNPNLIGTENEEERMSCGRAPEGVVLTSERAAGLLLKWPWGWREGVVVAA